MRSAACRANYTTARIATAQGSGRCYQHPARNQRVNPERHRRSKAVDCRAWTILAEWLEIAIKDLIVAKRGSSEYGRKCVHCCWKRGPHALAQKSMRVGRRSGLRTPC